MRSIFCTTVLPSSSPAIRRYFDVHPLKMIKKLAVSRKLVEHREVTGGVIAVLGWAACYTLSGNSRPTIRNGTALAGHGIPGATAAKVRNRFQALERKISE